MRNPLKLMLMMPLVLVLCSPDAMGQAVKQVTPVGVGTATPEKPAPDKALNWYRVEVAIHELEDGKRVNSRNYTLVLADDGKRVESKTGSRVPVATGKYEGSVTNPNQRTTTQFQYLDVGMNISCSASQRDGQLSVFTRLDWSSIAPEPGLEGQPVIRQLTVAGDAVITALGKPILFSSTDDAVSKRRYQVEVTVAKQ